MRGIIREHGDAITAFIVVIVIFGILFCSKMRNDISEAGNAESSMNYMGNADTVQQVVSGAVPEIRFQDSSVIYKNTEIDLRACFSVKYGTEEVVQAVNIPQENFKVKSIKNQRKEELLSQYQEDTGKMIFQEAGIYEIELCVKDNERRENRVVFKVPVEDIFQEDE